MGKGKAEYKYIKELLLNAYTHSLWWKYTIQDRVKGIGKVWGCVCSEADSAAYLPFNTQFPHLQNENKGTYLKTTVKEYDENWQLCM